ncbi:MAG: adenylate kinase [Bacteroidetes bacterium HGW-Bacteroidetes-1]|jgi:adenylate kinase|nr:MAG: adenylate kinase [Bacteroidetes bacterium HGW-Bacteroidetes-1]
MLNLILFGPPGAGKGTQSEMLMSRYNLNYISTGEALRNEIKEGSPLGLKAKTIIESGGLVDDEIIVQIIGNALSGGMRSEGFLFDGFPRTYVQAYILDGLFTRLQTSLTRIFILEVDEKECTKRLLQRATEQNRSDDNALVIKRRLQEYHQKTLPLLEFYESTGILTPINGLGTSEEVFDRINNHISEELNRRPANVILFGYPGAGRATQAARLASDFNLRCISTGELLQEEVQNNGALAHKIIPFLNNGLLVPDEMVIRLIEKKLKDTDGTGRGYVFKGYPRTLVQAYILDGLLKKQGTSISCVINLKVPVLELIRRLDARSHTPSKMPYDGSAATIVARLEEHEQRTEPVLDYYHQQNQVIEIDGTGADEVVYNRLQEPVLRAIKNMK